MAPYFRNILFLIAGVIAVVSSAPVNGQAEVSSSSWIFQKFARQGVPTAALKRVSDYLAAHQGESLTVQRKVRTDDSGYAPITFLVASQYAAIIDYSLPSTAQRFYLLNLTTGATQKFYVGHGDKSGVRYTTMFANIQDTRKSSLGLALTGEVYYGFHKKSMALYGLDPSNSNMDRRDIVLHGADYVSEDYIRQYGRLGRSYGCPAVERASLDPIVSALGVGSLIYFYHPSLMNEAARNPNEQQDFGASKADDPEIALPDEEADIQARRPPLVPPSDLIQ